MCSKLLYSIGPVPHHQKQVVHLHCVMQFKANNHSLYVCVSEFKAMRLLALRMRFADENINFQLAGEKLLERYGMTETGMVVSNPLEGTFAVSCPYDVHMFMMFI